MAFEPKNITREHVLRAVNKIEAENIALRPSTRWLVEIDGKQYPPKEVMRYAHEQLNGEKIWNYGGGPPTNSFLESMDFQISELSGTPQAELIRKYKLRLQEKGLQDELYKWKLLGAFRGKPDVEAADFGKEIGSVDFANLIYGVGLGVIKHLSGDFPEEYRTCFRMLFDDNVPLANRIPRFHDEVLKLYRQLVPNERLSHHHDERTMATFLTYHDPDKYTFFKDSFYQKLCKLLDVKARTKNEKYVHYLGMIDDFITDYILPDKELREKVSSLIPADAFGDPNHKILAQDILYTQLDQGLEELNLEGHSVYKISMGDFTDDEVEQCIKLNKVLVNEYTKGKGQSSETQGNIFQNIEEGDFFYLTHGNGPNKMKLVGRVVGPAMPTTFRNYAAEDWLERPFEQVFSAINKSAYKGANKWWTPNNNSTCIRIKESEIDEANKLLFQPYFNIQLQNSSQDQNDETMDQPLTPPDGQNAKHPLNQILFGPPGTGKTYNTINKALEIVGEDIEGKTRQQIKDLFDAKIKERQIVFTTFHQSMSYEDFIEGIKPIEPDREGDPVIYKIVLGIFRSLCIDASFAIAQLREGKATEEVLDFSILYDNFSESVEEKLLNGQPVELETKSGGSVMVESISQQGNFVIKHHEGTRTYTVSKARLTKLQSAISNLEDVNNINDQFRSIIGGSNSSAYWSVLNAIRKEKPAKVIGRENRSFTFEEKREVVLSLTKDDYKGKEGKPYVLIIDEINRGNVSQIFGELITLIEEDKRLGKEEALEATLPYSKEKFGVPPNLYIIGTMNTADRSVEALDAALRRRFSFEEMPPKPELIDERLIKVYADTFAEHYDLDGDEEPWATYENNFISLLNHNKEVYINMTYKPLQKVIEKTRSEENYKRVTDLFTREYITFLPTDILKTINGRIEKLLDKDHQIGHSYFMQVANVTDLQVAFHNKIIPLLQEYFFGDYGKIGLVLGKGFVEAEESREANIFADFGEYDGSEFSERVIYKLKDVTTMTETEFKTGLDALLPIKRVEAS